MPSTLNTLALLTLLSSAALASPVNEVPRTIIPLSKRNHENRHIIDARSDIPSANMTFYKGMEDHTINKYHATLSAAEINLGKALNGMTSMVQRSEIQKRATGGESLTAQQGGSYWTGTISVGTPAQSFSMDFDTVSQR